MFGKEKVLLDRSTKQRCHDSWRRGILQGFLLVMFVAGAMVYLINQLR